MSAQESGKVTEQRRLSHAIAEGDGISLVAIVDGADAARAAEAAGAEGLLVHNGLEDRLAAIRAAALLPILFYWDGERVDRLEGTDACIVEFGTRDFAEEASDFGELEVAWRVSDEEQIKEALDRFDPELFVLAGSLEHVLELLPDVPAGKLAIAELPTLTSEDVEELERAGVDAVIVHADDVSPLVGEPPPEV